MRITLLVLLSTLSALAQIRVNVGGPQYTDTNANTWTADFGCSSALTYTYSGFIAGTGDPTIYQSGRAGDSSLSCTYTVPSPAYYYVTLKFAETDPKVTAATTGPGANPRLMSVYVNGVLQYSNVNVRAVAGFATAYDLATTPIPLNTGQSLTVMVTQTHYQPMLAGIEIDAATPQSLLPANPTTYLWAHFRDDDQLNMRLSMSNDDLNWVDIASQGTFGVQAPDSLRDPSVLYENGVFYFTASPSGANPSKIHLFSSRTLRPGSFSGITLLDVSTFAPGATAVFAPELWHDPSSGFDYLWMPVSTASNPNALNAPFTMYLGRINLVTGAFVGIPQVVTINGTSQHRTFDPFPYFANNTYYLFYVDQTSAGDGSNDIVFQPIMYATSSVIGGPYTQVTTPGTDYFGWGDLQTEAPTLSIAPNGCVRITVDHWILPPVGPGSGGRKYGPLYKDSCPTQSNALFSTASLNPNQGSAPATPNITASEQGTILSFNSNVDAVAINTVLNAYIYSEQGQNSSARFGVNTNSPFYTFSVKTKAVAPGNIQYNEAASIGIDSGDGSYAEISSCGTNAGGCALQFPGANRLTVSSSATNGNGLVQLSNSHTDAEESSILLADGISQFGAVPISGSASADKAIWSVGENSKLMSPPNGHWFGVKNNGVGTVNYVTGGAPGGSFGNAVSGCYGMKITTGGSAIQVVGLGRFVIPGNIGNHHLVIENSSGVIIAQYSLDASTAYGATNHFTYSPIIPAFTLNSGTVYFIMSAETAGGDTWFDNTTAPTVTAVAAINQAAFQSGGCGVGAPALSGGAGNSWGALDMLYASNTDGSIGGFPLSVSPQTGEVHLPMGTSFGSGTGTLYNHTSYGSIDSLGSLGSTNRVNIGTGVLGSSDATTVTGAVDITRYIGSRSGSNTDLAGSLVLDGGGAASRSFVNSQALTSVCVASDSTANHSVQAFISAGVLQIRGTAGDSVYYICIAHEF